MDNKTFSSLTPQITARTYWLVNTFPLHICRLKILSPGKKKHPTQLKLSLMFSMTNKTMWYGCCGNTVKDGNQEN